MFRCCIRPTNPTGLTPVDILWFCWFLWTCLVYRCLLHKGIGTYGPTWKVHIAQVPQHQKVATKTSQHFRPRLSNMSMKSDPSGARSNFDKGHSVWKECSRQTLAILDFFINLCNAYILWKFRSFYTLIKVDHFSSFCQFWPKISQTYLKY